MLTIGSRAQVMHGNADHTAGGLKKGDLMKSRSGKIVSRKAHAAGLKAMARLRKSGKMAAPFTGKGRKRTSTKKNSARGNAYTNRRGRLHNTRSGKYLPSPKMGGFW
jgi:hypothetical protein